MSSGPTAPVSKAMNKKFDFKKGYLLFAATNLISLGVSLFLESRLGSDPLTVLQEGIHHVLHISVGTASFLYNAVILTAALILARNKLGVGTVIYSLTVGFFIDLYCGVLSRMPVGDLLTVRIVCLTAGQIVLSMGYALLIELKLGVNGLDAILLYLETKIHLSYKYLRTLADALYALSGFLLGGVIGLGTIVSILATGYFIAVFRNSNYFKMHLRNKSERKNNQCDSFNI